MNNHAGWLRDGSCVACGSTDTSMPCSISDAHEIIKILREENAHLKRLPELEWAEVCAALMAYVVELADAGQTAKAVELTRIIDRGSNYIEKTLYRTDLVVKAAEELLSKASRAPFGALRSDDVAFKKLEELVRAYRPENTDIDLDIDVWPSG